MLAVLADIHGNAWALRAVLEELERRGIREAVNLGDCFYGPLDPAGTLEILRSRSWPTVRGNEDRCFLEEGSGQGSSKTLEFGIGALGASGLEWLAGNTRCPFLWKGMFLCHGTPSRDDEYLLELVTPEGTRLRTPSEVDALLSGVSSRIVLCAHSHVPNVVVTAGGTTVINPGSVGLPAYQDDHPYPHRMETGSPMASFAVLREEGSRPAVDLVRVPYDAPTAARRARENTRPDWSDWLLGGFAR